MKRTLRRTGFRAWLGAEKLSASCLLGGVPSILWVPAAWPPAIEPGPQTASPSPASMKPSPEGRSLNSVLPNDPSRRRRIARPQKESRQCRPRPCPGLSFKLSSSVQPLLQWPAPLPSTLRAPRPPKSLGLSKLKKSGGRCQVSTHKTRSHAHIHENHLFCTPAGAEVINSHDCAAIQVRPGDEARPQALLTARPPQSWLWLCKHGQRGKVCSRILNSETASAFPNQTESQSEKLWRVQINTRGELTLTGRAPFFRVLRTCGFGHFCT